MISRIPNYPFVINRESYQSRGLIFWTPMPMAMRFHTDTKVREFIEGVDNGTPTGGATYALSQIGRAVFLDGTDDWVNFDTYTLINSRASFTVTCWCNTNTLSGGGANLRYPFAQEGTSAPTTTFIIRLNTTTDHFDFFVGGSGYVGVSTASNSAIIDTWHLLVGTYDGANVRVYLDGIEKDSTAKTGGTGSGTTTDLKMGNTGASPQTRWWSGMVGDCRIYNRHLSPAEIYGLYNPQTRWDLYKPIHETLALVVPVAAAGLMHPYPSRMHPSKNILLRL